MAKNKGKSQSLAVAFDQAEDSGEAPAGEELEEGDELGDAQPDFSFTAGATAHGAPFSVPVETRTASADAILALARQHLDESYILGARAPMANAGWKGPWDCAEFVSWCVYQATGVLFGTSPRNDPMLADAYTGYWYRQALETGGLIDWRDAANIAGAVVLRRPAPGQTGHIVLSDGSGGTVEAHSRLRGVIASTLEQRRWDCGILVPGVRYAQSDSPIVLADVSALVLRVTQPLLRGDRVRRVQQRLQALNYPVGAPDGLFGPQTASAVRAFQQRNGLVADGEVGSATEAALFSN